jgi:hypothetical protein
VDTVHAEFSSNRPRAILEVQCHLTHFDFFRTNCTISCSCCSPPPPFLCALVPPVHLSLSGLASSPHAGSSGVFDRGGIPHGDYTLRVVARDPSRPNEARAIVRNRLWVHGDDIFCVTHLMNRGFVVSGNNLTVEFQATGVVTSYLCSLDRMEYMECEFGRA